MAASSPPATVLAKTYRGSYGIWCADRSLNDRSSVPEQRDALGPDARRRRSCGSTGTPGSPIYLAVYRCCTVALFTGAAPAATLLLPFT